MSDPISKPEHLEPSELGTQEYWTNLYNTELANHAANPADTGTVWFDDSDAEAKLVSFLDDAAADGGSLNKRTTSFLDLGCGNGSLLFALRADDWDGEVMGVDYCRESIELANTVGEYEVSENGVTLRVWDVLTGPLKAVTSISREDGGWDVVLDKGTFDAVSLSDERDEEGRRVCEGYRDRVLQLLHGGGWFLVTSCNWTESELRRWFEGGEGTYGEFKQVGRVEYPSFSFGGVKGQSISSVCFEKKETTA